MIRAIRRIWDGMHAFPPGRVPLLLVIAAVLSGAYVATRAATHRPADIEIWTFNHLSALDFGAQLRELDGDETVRLQNLGRAMTDRLSLAVMSGDDLPDLVEIEQSEFGRFLRGPIEDIPFVDLTERIDSEGWRDKLVASRLSRYSIDGHVFGIPHDLHPAILIYRPDVMAELGYLPSELQTWDAWVAAAKDFYRPGEPGTHNWRYGLALSDVEAFDYLMLLWQRGGDIFDERGDVVIDGELAVDTLEKYLELFEGPTPAAGPKLSGWSEDFAALARGQIVALPVVDWMLATMQLEADAILHGRVRCMPLPAWTPGGRRTSTSGGTLMAIPKAAHDVNASWQWAKTLYFNRDSLINRFRVQSVVPPLRPVLDDPAFDEPVEFFGGQRVGRLLTELAHDVPPVNGSPYLPEAYDLLNVAFAQVMREQLTPREALDRVAADLRRTIARDRVVLRRAEEGGD